ncbi:DNA-binding response regulator [Actinorhabdospora filicis]|uniref:DNA-binding response regulator n=2 Tax=Actinorhabdospora filicis TaxID=1785913 RepID=A0A9W6W8M0_9ACTN|nr:DNA-binding response regulator [Actinorhabdospora filicis]
MRVILAEDEVLMREGITALLHRFGHEVTASVGTPGELIAAVRATRPDLVLTDVRMPPSFTDEGLRAALELRGEFPGLPVFVLSLYVEQTYAAELLDSGGGDGVGYMLKDRVGDVHEFAEALERVAGGGTVVDPHVVRQLLALRRDPVSRLTPREREVLERMAEGRSNAAIARELFVTEAAVGKHIRAIFAKLELGMAENDHRRVLAVLAYLRGR